MTNCANVLNRNPFQSAVKAWPRLQPRLGPSLSWPEWSELRKLFSFQTFDFDLADFAR